MTQFVARLYQLEALEEAKKGNTIVCLPPGAVLLIREHLEKFVKTSSSRQWCIYLAPTQALVCQQANVMETSLPLAVGKLVGQGKTPDPQLNDIEWEKTFAEAEIIVMTPMILLNLLRQAFVSISQIGILVLDECHHCTKDHPYRCIMREFYVASEPHKRPLLLGLTGTPSKSISHLDNMSTIDTKLRQLEEAMLSKLIVPKQREELDQIVHKPTFIVIEYSYPPPSPCKRSAETILDGLLRKFYYDERFSRYIRTLQHILTNLGIWATYTAITDYQIEGIRISQQNNLCTPEEASFYRKMQDIQRTFARVLSSGPLGKPNTQPTESVVTEKVMRLLSYLYNRRLQVTLCGIIFVTRRIVAHLLAKLINLFPSFDGVVAQALVSKNTDDNIDSDYDPFCILQSFGSGETHLLVATKVAEEGIDIRTCDFIVHFDEIPKLPSLLQTAGRARAKDSHVVLMIERSDEKAARIVDNLENQIQKTEECVSSQRHTEDEEDELRSQFLPCGSEYSFKLKSGATITLESAVDLLHRYCMCLPHDPYTKVKPTFEAQEVGSGRYRYIIRMPIGSHFSTHIGSAAQIKSIAKRLACLEACVRLIECGGLDDHLRPVVIIRPQHIERVKAVNLAETSIHQATEVTVFHDDFVFSHNKAKAFFYTIHFEGLEANSVLSGCQFALLMSNYYSRPFEFTTNASFSKHIVRISPGKQTFLDVDEMKKAFAFWKWLKFLLSHADAGATQPASTFLTSEHPHGIIAVPVKEDDPQQIDWDVIESVLNLSFDTVWELFQQQREKTTELLNHHLVYSPIHKRVYKVEQIHWDLTCDAPMKPATTKFASIRDYYEYKLSHRGGGTVEPEQPILEGSPLLVRCRNILSARSEHVKKESKAETLNETNSSPKSKPTRYLLPQLTRIFPMTTERFKHARCLGSVLWRLENYLRTKEFQQTYLEGFGNISTDVILEALTLPATAEMMSYERLETLGDAFLKFATTQHLFFAYPRHHEGILSRTKSILVSNAYLAHLVCDYHLKEIAPYISGRRPNSKSLSQFGSNSDLSFEMCTKQLADIAEALVGAIYLQSGEKQAFKFLRWLGYNEFQKWNVHINFDEKEISDTEKFVLDWVQKNIGYQFKNKYLLYKALVHPTYVTNYDANDNDSNKVSFSSYQRLEFLGDAVLDIVITRYWLFQNFPNETPHLYTRMRAAVVSNSTYAFLAAELGLYRFAFHYSPKLQKDMGEYVRDCVRACRYSTDKIPDYPWEYNFDPVDLLTLNAPKVLADLIESLVGAIYLDLDYNLEKVWNVVKPLLLRMLERVATPSTVPDDFVSNIHCWASRYAASITIVSEQIKKDLVKAIVVINEQPIAEAYGSTAKAAKIQASKKALKKVSASDFVLLPKALVDLDDSSLGSLQGFDAAQLRALVGEKDSDESSSDTDESSSDDFDDLNERMANLQVTDSGSAGSTVTSV